MLIGVTGGIGSGKSLVAAMLGDLLDAPVYSSDAICRKLLEVGEEGYHAFVAAFGDRFLTESGAVDRVLLRATLFADEGIRKTLEAILHPLVRTQLHEAGKAGPAAATGIAEVPLLFECGWEDDFDVIVCVTAGRDIARERVVARDSTRGDEVERIIAAQMNPAEKARRSDWVIDNGSTLAETRRQVERLAARLRE